MKYRIWRKYNVARPNTQTIECSIRRYGTKTVMERPKTIHDFGGFPRMLYEYQFFANRVTFGTLSMRSMWIGS